MGMSASQARFLSLTARKNNVEFEGQQINQQRTTLSNESASYYSMLCDMEVPVPPSIDDYTKVTYTFNDGAMTNTLISLLPDKTTAGANNRYVVNYVEEWQDDYAIVPAASSMVEKKGDDTFAIGSTTLRKIGNGVKEVTVDGTSYHIGEDGKYYSNNSNSNRQKEIVEGDNNKYYVVLGTNEGYEEGDYISNNFTKGDKSKVLKINGKLCYSVSGAISDIGTESNSGAKVGYVPYYNEVPDSQSELKNKINKEFEKQTNIALSDDAYAKTLSESQRSAMLQNEEYLLKMVQEKTGDSGDFYIRYVQNATTGNYDPYLYASSELHQEQKYNNKNLASIPCFSLGSTKQTREILHKEATVEKDSSGRYVAITINIGEDENGEDIVRTYALTTTTTTDEEAYNDAMNEYNYKQHEYDHRIQEINSKLEIVQQQDKQLELKLKQLDTEENAISTEMDAVKKVISKNVESSFKTFNA